LHKASVTADVTKSEQIVQAAFCTANLSPTQDFLQENVQ